MMLMNWLEVITALALVVTAVFSFCFWYARNRPNIIVKPNFTEGIVLAVITNEGLSHASNLQIKCSSLKVSRGSEQTLDVCVPAMYPTERYEYAVAASHHAVEFEPFDDLGGFGPSKPSLI